MGNPKQRHTKNRRNNRRMHLFLANPAKFTCPKCGKAVLAHTVCHNCGYYKGTEVIDVLEKLNKKERKLKEREMAAKEAEGKTTGKEQSLNWEGLSKK
jgi:large subunit ribosomal protein L32